MKTLQNLLSARLAALPEKPARQAKAGIFATRGQSPRSGRCEAVALSFRRAGSIPQNGNPGFIDAARACAAQRVEHYEIASHGCLRAWAKDPGNQTAAQLLHTILKEEKSADRVLSRRGPALQEPASGNDPENTNAATLG